MNPLPSPRSSTQKMNNSCIFNVFLVLESSLRFVFLLVSWTQNTGILFDPFLSFHSHSSSSPLTVSRCSGFFLCHCFEHTFSFFWDSCCHHPDSDPSSGSNPKPEALQCLASHPVWLGHPSQNTTCTSSAHTPSACLPNSCKSSAACLPWIYRCIFHSLPMWTLDNGWLLTFLGQAGCFLYALWSSCYSLKCPFFLFSPLKILQGSESPQSISVDFLVGSHSILKLP